MNELRLKRMTEDSLVNIYSYLKIAEAYVDKNLNIEPMVHIGLLLDKMTDEIEKVKPFYETLKYFNTAKINPSESSIPAQSEAY